MRLEASLVSQKNPILTPSMSWHGRGDAKETNPKTKYRNQKQIPSPNFLYGGGHHAYHGLFAARKNSAL
jgi:hypothetical protein